MPKLSKRKRQLKEIYFRRQDESEHGSNPDEPNGNDEDTNDEMSEDIKKPTKTTKSQKNENTSKKSAEEEKVWVQCNDCDKWRSLPSHVDPESLPEIWTCDQNSFDPSRMSCEAPEESYKQPEEEQHAPLKSFLHVWAKRLKNTDRAEHRLPSSASTRGKKRKLDVEYIRCCNPSCGKWRAVTSQRIDSNFLLQRLNKGKKPFTDDVVWYCSMNFWDDTTASCAAPQEPLWKCRWNVNS